MNKVNWAQVAVFGIVALLVLLIGLSLLPLVGGGGWGSGMMGGWGGMMGPGMMGSWGGSLGGGWGALGWLFSLIGLVIPVGFLALLVLGGVWLFRQAGGSQGLSSGPGQAAPGETCPSCSRAVQSDWQLCPYCGQGLV